MFERYIRRTKSSTGPMSPGLTDMLAHRIDQQIKRVYRRTYNAEIGLKTLVQQAVTNMVLAGATPEQIRHVFVARIEDQAGAGRDSIVTGGSHASQIIQRVLAWCDESHAGLSVADAHATGDAR